MRVWDFSFDVHYSSVLVLPDNLCPITIKYHLPNISLSLQAVCQKLLMESLGPQKISDALRVFSLDSQFLGG